MVYQGRGGNDNQFSHLDECERLCHTFKPFNVVTPLSINTQNPEIVKAPLITTFSKSLSSSFNKPIKNEKSQINMVQGTLNVLTKNDLGVIGAPAPAQPM